MHIWSFFLSFLTFYLFIVAWEDARVPLHRRGRHRQPSGDPSRCLPRVCGCAAHFRLAGPRASRWCSWLPPVSALECWDCRCTPQPLIFLKLIFTWVIGIELKFSGVVTSTFYPPSQLHGPEFYFLVCLFLCVLLSGEGRWWWVDMSYIDVISFLKTVIMLRQFPLTYFLFFETEPLILVLNPCIFYF